MGTCAAAAPAARIPEDKITALETELNEGKRGTTPVDVRRSCKSVIRQAQALVAGNPESPNRFALLGIMFEGQKILMSLDQTVQNRDAIFETAAELMKAPDEYSEARLEAELILSERGYAEAKATVEERLEGLEALLRKYRGTSGEWMSLKVGSMIAAKLTDFDLEQEIIETMKERFGADHEAIEYLRKKQPGSNIEAVFGGTCKTHDGKSIIFPNDRLGHQYCVCFWSQDAPGIDEQLKAIKKLQSERPALSEIYSFNLDELPDAGRKKLNSLEINWPAMHLPGGKESPLYKAYSRKESDILLVNGQGQVFLGFASGFTRRKRKSEEPPDVLAGWNIGGLIARTDKDRYLAQLRYFFNGDFLLGFEKSVQPALKECFVQPPFRYRLKHDEELANYRKAEKLCADALKQNTNSKDVWVIRNHRIIALLGMWNLAREPNYLEQAVKEAQTTLTMDLPEGVPGTVPKALVPGGDLVARFCLAKSALRGEDADPEKVLEKFIEEMGGDQASPKTLAAAAVLAIESNASTAHEKYRKKFLGMDVDGDSSLWPVCAFLRDKHHRYRNFHASPGGGGYDRPQKYAYRHMISGLSDPLDTSRRLEVELKKVDGGSIRIPNDYTGQLLGVIFVELSDDVGSRSNLVKQVSSLTKVYNERSVKVVVSFLSEDIEAARSAISGIDAPCQAGLLPDGLSNPLVQKLGILSADRVANPMLLRKDGSIAWSASGLEYVHFGSFDAVYPILSGILSNIEKVRCDEGFTALENGKYKEALKLFDEYEPLPGRGEDWWAADRHHGRALAYMGLKDWKSALTEINAAIEQRLMDFKSAVCKCHGYVEMYLTKATILEKLDKKSEAIIERRRAENETLPHAKLPPGLARQGVPIGVYYDWLKEIRLKMEKE